MFKLNAYQLKWIAIIGMFSWHLSFVLRDILSLWILIPMTAVGGLTFPIMGFFVVEGYKHTSNLAKYIIRLVIVGAVSVPLYMFTLNVSVFNIMFSIALSLLVLKMYDAIKGKPIFWVLFIVIIVPGTLLIMFDWIFIAPLVVVLYYTIKNETARRIVPGIVAAFIWTTMGAGALWGLSIINPLLETEYAEHVMPIRDGIYAAMGNTNAVIASLTFGLGCLAAAFLIKNYNGERGKRMKWLFYTFYPIHLAIIAVVMIILGIGDFSVFGF